MLDTTTLGSSNPLSSFIPFNGQVSLTARTQYALVVHIPDAFQCCNWPSWYGTAYNYYPGGEFRRVLRKRIEEISSMLGGPGPPGGPGGDEVCSRDFRDVPFMSIS